MLPEDIATLIRGLNAQMNNSPKITLTEVQALAELLPKVQGILDKTLGPWHQYAENEWWRSPMVRQGRRGEIVRKADGVWRIGTMNCEIHLPLETPVEVCKELSDLMARMWGYTLLDDPSETPISEDSSA